MWQRLKNTNDGESYRVVDMTKFVDPRSFQKVIPTLYQEAPSEDAFIREVWNIVTQLALYSKEITETPCYPLEHSWPGVVTVRILRSYLPVWSWQLQ